MTDLTCHCDDPKFRFPHILHDLPRAMAAMTEVEAWRIERAKARKVRPDAAAHRS